MSDQYKQEQIAAIEGRLTVLRKDRAEAFGKMQAAELAARQARADVEGLDKNISIAEKELEAAKAA